MHNFELALKNKKILITGHTGFKGSWLLAWLSELGAEIYGIALEPETNPSMFQELSLENDINHLILDIRKKDAIIEHIRDIDPEVIFHLAAQPLVRRSYDEPLETFETNILGTAYVLEAARLAKSTQAVVCVTSDKVYKNNEWEWPYRETDHLGGKDPYSASKSAAEMIASSYNNSFYSQTQQVALATARGGNVIGGGDWAEDRLIPDIVRAITRKSALSIRNPRASRPWQHVLCLCHGYLQLAGALLESADKVRGSWNFGPGKDDVISVEKMLEKFDSHWEIKNVEQEPTKGKPEAQALDLDSSKALRILKWRPALNLENGLKQTCEWYKAHDEGHKDMREVTRDQINAYRQNIDTD